MKLNEYIRSRGLTPQIVAAQIGISKQGLAAINNSGNPHLKTLMRISTAMTELGAPTTIANLTSAVYSD